MVNKEWNRHITKEVIIIIIVRDAGNLDRDAGSVGVEWLSYFVIL